MDNAMLLLAAPNMLKALYGILNVEGGKIPGFDWAYHFNQVHDAIKKATKGGLQCIL